MDTELSPEECARAIKEAQAKGLPDGWSVKLDVSESRVIEAIKKKKYSNVYFRRNDDDASGSLPMASPVTQSRKLLQFR